MGSDSEIGKAKAIEVTREGTDVVITYHSDEKGAKDILQKVEGTERKGVLLQVDISEEKILKMFDLAIKDFGEIAHSYEQCRN
jgi:glucose 1-dehydrogenase